MLIISLRALAVANRRQNKSPLEAKAMNERHFDSHHRPNLDSPKISPVTQILHNLRHILSKFNLWHFIVFWSMMVTSIFTYTWSNFDSFDFSPPGFSVPKLIFMGSLHNIGVSFGLGVILFLSSFIPTKGHGEKQKEALADCGIFSIMMSTLFFIAMAVSAHLA